MSIMIKHHALLYAGLLHAVTCMLRVAMHEHMLSVEMHLEAMRTLDPPLFQLMLAVHISAYVHEPGVCCMMLRELSLSTRPLTSLRYAQ